MRKILSINYSQTGQLFKITESTLTPLKESEDVEVECVTITPRKAFPFPWPFLEFFRILPETVDMDPIQLEPLEIKYEKYDLIVLSYQVWFLSPSLPISSWMQSAEAQQLFQDTPVVTLIGCRGMWLTAQEKMKKLLADCEARLVDNVVLTDQCGAAFSFLATPLWMFTGKRQPLSWVPSAGVSSQAIAEANRFGQAILEHLTRNSDEITDPMLKGLGAVRVNEKLIASEKIANRSFRVWSKILKKMGSPQSSRRTLGLCIYITFLIILILTVVPITALFRKLMAPFLRHKTTQQKLYYAQPSGESLE